MSAQHVALREHQGGRTRDAAAGRQPDVRLGAHR